MEPFNVFLQMTTQWIIGGIGAPVGLNYSSLGYVMDLFAVENKRECFSKIRVLEFKALELLKAEGKDGSTA